MSTDRAGAGSGHAAVELPTRDWPEPPYYAAILKVARADADAEGYGETLARMLDLARRQPGYLGRESATANDGDELTIVYYIDEASIRAWHDDPEHLLAQHLGRSRWYKRYEVRIARVERSYRHSR